MWAIVFLAGCAGSEATAVRWSFADHRSCTEANVVTVVVRGAARELARVACSDGVAPVGDADDEVLVAEALGYHGTVMYRARFRPRAGESDVTLRYVGGRGQ